MRWKRGHRSEHVTVRGGGGGRGIGAAGALLPLAGRFGLPGILVLLAVVFLGPKLCGDDFLFLGGGGGEPAAPVDEEAVSFVSFVLDDAQETMAGAFAARGERYQPAKLVIFRGQTRTACGFGSAATGPFYCPRDRTIYIDLSFYAELRQRFGAPGDFAQAYVIAHEVGHHAQNLLGLLEGARGRGAESLAVRQELQADCFAGVWAHSTEQRDLLEAGDIEEALRAAAAIGDDALQEQSGQVIQPETWSHGSSEQRVRWLRRGMAEGRLDACDTRSADRL